jgi:DNA transposition AAA+ family ATPase
MMQDYKAAKNTFIDEVRVEDYIGLEGSRKAYERLEDSIDKPMKMILVYGQPGTGKTLMLNRIYHNHRHQKDIHFIDTPIGSRKEFYRKLFEIITGKMMPSNSKIEFETFVEYGKKMRGRRDIVILLDEAQIYPGDMLEEIRILSDTGSMKFVLSAHETEGDELLSKKHFQSRIWERIELKNADFDELKTYIYKRLLNRGLIDIANQFSDKQNRFIFKMTKGNFRECNKPLYSAFEIYEYYETHKPEKVDYKRISMKILEMAAIKSGFIDV